MKSIIDSFSTMQNEEEEVLKDYFICCIPRDSYEKAGIEFKDHIRKEHNMWYVVVDFA